MSVFVERPSLGRPLLQLRYRSERRSWGDGLNPGKKYPVVRARALRARSGCLAFMQEHASPGSKMAAALRRRDISGRYFGRRGSLARLVLGLKRPTLRVDQGHPSRRAVHQHCDFMSRALTIARSWEPLNIGEDSLHDRRSPRAPAAKVPAQLRTARVGVLSHVASYKITAEPRGVRDHGLT